jgi:predicted PurR-regulated permease PerM
VLVFGMWLLGEVLTPFIAGMVLAYFLDPLADALERLRLPRWLATALILLACIGLFVAMFLLLLPLVAEQARQFVEHLPDQLKRLALLIENATPESVKQALERTMARDNLDAAQLAGKAAGWLAGVLKSLITGTAAVFNFLSLLIITPIVLFYMLNDWDRMVATVDSWLPRRHADVIRGIARDIDRAMAGFIRGQGTVALILGVFYAVSLVAVGLNFGLLIGLLSGVLSIIPYVGATVGGVLSIGMALVQFWPDWTMVLLVLGIYAVGQFVEGNFLSPKLVGDSVGLHPVWMMFALMAFGYLFGFAGLLLAVPLAAAIRVVASWGLKQYLNSALYHGEEKCAAGQGDEPRPEEPEAVS